MKYTLITGNGDFPLTSNGTHTNSSEVTLYAPDDIGGANLTVSYKDHNSITVPYTPDGGLLVKEQLRVRCGKGVNLMMTITGFTTEFSIGLAS